MKRSPLKSNPETLRAWQERSRRKVPENRELTKPGIARGINRTPKSDPPELVAARKVVHTRSGGRCEVRSKVCTHRAVHVHHRGGRRFAGCHNPELLADCCLACHDLIHSGKGAAWAWASGWLVKKALGARGEYTPASVLAAA